MMQNNVKIAITGGICSGKSTVAQIIKEKGFPVYSCDEIYSELLQDVHFVDTLDNEFVNIKNSDGSLNRAKLSEIVFNDSGKLKKLNSITHPKIMERVFTLMSGKGLCFCEVPLLFESGYEPLFDNVIVVLRGEDDRVRELMQRNKIEKSQALLRIKSQFNYDKHKFTKYYVIHNNGDLFALSAAVTNTLEKIKEDYI